MKDIRCLLGHHKFSEWVEVDNHLERECLRCPKVEAKYPPPEVLIAKIAADFLWKYYMLKTPPMMFIPPNKGVFKPKDNR